MDMRSVDIALLRLALGAQRRLDLPPALPAYETATKQPGA
jgi:hypothetical protein